jgi:hypothetical protein
MMIAIVVVYTVFVERTLVLRGWMGTTQVHSRTNPVTTRVQGRPPVNKNEPFRFLWAVRIVCWFLSK